MEVEPEYPEFLRKTSKPKAQFCKTFGHKVALTGIASLASSNLEEVMLIEAKKKRFY